MAPKKLMHGSSDPVTHGFDMSDFQYQLLQATSQEEFVEKAVSFLESSLRSPCVLGLSGGSTPAPVYSALGKRDVDWSGVTIVLLDERYVPSLSSDSNQKMVAETLLAHADIPKENIVFPDTSLPLEECIADYEARLPQAVDIAVLGMGEDGHIASLFPGDIDALLEQEEYVLHTTTDVFAVHDRITVTLPVLERVEKPCFLLQGEAKKKMFSQMMSANMDTIEYPAHALLAQGKTTWITCW